VVGALGFAATAKYSVSRSLLVIPNFRDSSRLAPFLRDLVVTLPVHFSILVSEDGSGSEEVGRIRALISDVRQEMTGRGQHGPELLEPLLHHPNTGKGGAVLRGWSQRAGYELLAFADADGAVSAGEIVRAEKFMRSSLPSIDALFGSRVKMMGRTIHRKMLRHYSGRIFATLVSTVAQVPAYDTQCGLKILTAAAFEKIRPFTQSVGFAFDVELLLLLLKSGQRVVEFPIDWEDVAGSKVHLLRDSTRMAREVFRIRRRVQSLKLDAAAGV
jgi:glycosyltransferase involved in cell wall biosynthesis